MNVLAYSKAKSGSKKQFHLFFVPKKSLLCIERLKHKGVFGSVMLVDEFKCQLFPVDSDVVSMEISEAYRLEYFYLIYLHSILPKLNFKND